MIHSFRRLSISAKLGILMLITSSIGVLLVGGLGWQLGKQGIEARVFDELTSTRDSKAQEIEDGYQEMTRDVLTFAESPVTIEALKAFHASLQAPDPVGQLPEGWEAQLKERYNEKFLTPLNAVSDNTWTLDAVWPSSPLARRMQYLHTLGGPKDSSANPQGTWEAAYQRYNKHFSTLARRFEFDLLLLVDVDGGTIAYSTTEWPDLGTRIEGGPWANTHLADAITQAEHETGEDKVIIEDYTRYPPAHDEAIAFLATPVRDNGKLLGVLVAEVSEDRIERITTTGGNWEAEGLGKTGEIYLVGPDHLLRSNARFSIEAPDAYLETLRRHGADATMLKRIKHHGSTILEERIDTAAVTAGFNGESGTGIITDERGNRVLSSWMPIKFHGLDWVLVAEMDETEALAPVIKFGEELAAGFAVLLLIVFALAIGAARYFVQPILTLVSASRQLGSGRWDVRVRSISEDEFGQLGLSFNAMADSLQHQTETIVSRSKEKDKLLDVVRGMFGRYMSEDVARRLLNTPESAELGGEEREVSVLFSDIEGYSTMAELLPPNEVVQILNKYLGEMNEIIEAHEGVVLEYMGDGILVVFGAPDDLPDHAEKAVRCARSMRARLKQLNAEWDESGWSRHWQQHGMQTLKTRFGLHSGNVVAGNIGSELRMKYGIIGDTVNVAARLEALNKDLNTTILASEDLVERLPEALLAEAEQRGEHHVKGRGQVVRVLAF